MESMGNHSSVGGGCCQSRERRSRLICSWFL